MAERKVVTEPLMATPIRHVDYDRDRAPGTVEMVYSRLDEFRLYTVVQALAKLGLTVDQVPNSEMSIIAAAMVDACTGNYDKGPEALDG